MGSRLIVVSLLLASGWAQAQSNQCATLVPPSIPVRPTLVPALAPELALPSHQLGAPTGVLAQAFDESQSVDQVLFRLRVEGCSVANALPAPTPASGIIDPATYKPKTEFDNTPWRFNMSQNGKQMTADEFSAWMKARGVRVAKGGTPPAARRCGPASRRISFRRLPRSGRPVACRRLLPQPSLRAVPDPAARGTSAPAEARSRHRHLTALRAPRAIPAEAKSARSPGMALRACCPSRACARAAKQRNGSRRPRHGRWPHRARSRVPDRAWTRDRIAVDGRALDDAARIYLMLNKPRGLVTTATDERGRDTVYRCFDGAGLPWLAPVGRLDKASEGLLLFCNDPRVGRARSPIRKRPRQDLPRAGGRDSRSQRCLPALVDGRGRGRRAAAREIGHVAARGREERVAGNRARRRPQPADPPAARRARHERAAAGARGDRRAGAGRPAQRPVARIE